MAYRAVNYSQLTEEDQQEMICRCVRFRIADTLREELRDKYRIDIEDRKEEGSVFQQELLREYRQSKCAYAKWLSYLRDRYVPRKFRKAGFVFGVRKSDGALIVWEDLGTGEADVWEHRLEGIGQGMLDTVQRSFYETDFKFDHMSFILAGYVREEDRQIVEKARRELEEAAVCQYIITGELESMSDFHFPYCLYDWSVNFYEKKIYSGQGKKQREVCRG